MAHPNDVPSPRLDPANAQNEPLEQGALDATDEQKIAGIVEQTRQDLVSGHKRSARELLAQRFEQSAITVDGARIDTLAAELEAEPA